MKYSGSFPIFLLTLIASIYSNLVIAQQTPPHTAIALSEFTVISQTDPALGIKARLILSSELSKSPTVSIVERDDLSPLLDERSFSLSNDYSGDNRLGLQGIEAAEYLLGSSILWNNSKIHFFCKLVNVEDGTMKAFTLNGRDEESLDSVASRVSQILLTYLEAETNKPRTPPIVTLTRVAALDKQLKDYEKPTISISIKETHIRKNIIDPAAETEFSIFATESGFPVIDSSPKFEEFTNINIIGEGFTVVSYRRGNATGVTARLEVKAIDKQTGRILAIDRQTSVALGTDELIGSKNALAKASAAIAERMLPKLVIRKD